MGFSFFFLRCAKVNTASALRVYDILRADKIIIEASALQFIQEFYGDSDSE